MAQTTGHTAQGPDRPGPRVTAIRVAFPPHLTPQEELLDAQARQQKLSTTALQVLQKVRTTTGIVTRHMALPLPELEGVVERDDFTETNRLWLSTALDLSEEALSGALRLAGIRPNQVDMIVSTTVTGLAVPSLEARLADRIGLRPNVKRIPLFGNGCAGGVAALARLHDYLRAHPDQVAVLLAVELCSLAYRSDGSLATVIAGSLFGDGAAAVVAVGADQATGATGPELVDTGSWLVPHSQDVLGWDIGAHGFRILLSPEIPALAAEHLPTAVHDLLGPHGLAPPQLGSWIVHGAGPKVFTAVEEAFALPPDALDLTRRSVSARGNLSSVSVLDVLHTAMQAPPPPGTPGLVVAMGPGFSIESALVRW